MHGWPKGWWLSVRIAHEFTASSLTRASESELITVEMKSERERDRVRE